MTDFLKFLADFGDSAVLIALVFSAAFYLLWCRHNNEALAIVTALLGSAAVISVLKLIMISCGSGHFDIRSPSGHSALSIAVYGTFGLLFFRYFEKWYRYLVSVALFALGATIAVSRVIMNLHSMGEMILGSIVGILTLLASWFFFLHKKEAFAVSEKPRPFNIYIVIAILIVVAGLVHGTRLPSEDFIQKLARDVKASLTFCQ